ncbi:TPA: hypothetical protein ACFIY7_002266, partial [Neisseria gonorrhoeae]
TWDNSNIQRLAEALEILDSHFRGNDAVQVSVWMDSSFPRRRESGPVGHLRRFAKKRFTVISAQS